MIDRIDYLFLALQSDAIYHRQWALSIFGILVPSPPSSEFPFRLTRDDLGCSYYDQDNERVYIKDSKDPDVPLFTFNEVIELPGGMLKNAPEDIRTTIGNLYFNKLCLEIPFGDRVPYQNDLVDVGKIESKYVEPMLIDDPDPDEGQEPPEGKIFVRQYKVFCDHVLSLVALNNVAVVSASPKSMTGHPDRHKVKKALLKEYEGQLDDPTVVAEIGNVLEELDHKWLDGDPAARFYDSNSNKYFGVVRKKLFYLGGGEDPFGDGTEVHLIENSLEEGMDVKDLPAIINSLRYGSYSRGSQTQLGGETTKTIYRMMGATRVSEPDCGSTVGLPIKIMEWNIPQYVGFYQIVANGEVSLTTAESLKALVGKTIYLRSPFTCKTPGRAHCEVCVGPVLAQTPGGLTSAAANLGGRFLTSFLKKMHGTTLTTTEWKYTDHIH